MLLQSELKIQHIVLYPRDDIIYAAFKDDGHIRLFIVINGEGVVKEYNRENWVLANGGSEIIRDLVHQALSRRNIPIFISTERFPF